jgi:hypothetical protein
MLGKDISRSIDTTDGPITIRGLDEITGDVRVATSQYKQPKQAEIAVKAREANEESPRNGQAAMLAGFGRQSQAAVLAALFEDAQVMILSRIPPYAKSRTISDW